MRRIGAEESLFVADGEDIAPTARIVTEERRECLLRQLKRRPRTRDARTDERGVVIIIPTHNDPSKDRVDLLDFALRSLSHQWQAGFDEPMHVVIADNGLTEAQRRAIHENIERLRDESGLSEAQMALHIADARPRFGFQRSPSHARNVGIDYAIASDLPGAVVFMDDDVAVLPGTLTGMLGVLRQTGAAAVVPSGMAVSDIRARYEALRDQPSPGRVEARPVPSLLNEQCGFDMGSVVAFSGLVATKSALTCFASDVVRRVIDSSGSFYVPFPGLSMEDMVATAAVQPYGMVYHAPFRFLDQVPEVEDILFRQKARWGWDHGLVTRDLVAIGAMKPGVHVLEPLRSGGWRQKTVQMQSDADPIHGVVVNPAELMHTAHTLETMLEHGTLRLPADGYPPHVLRNGLGAMHELLERLRHESTSVYLERADLPTLSIRDRSHRRWSREADASQLAGNLRALSDATFGDDGLPSVFLFGTRQPSFWAGG